MLPTLNSVVLECNMSLVEAAGVDRMFREALLSNC